MCVLVWDHAHWLGKKQNTLNLYLQADDKRCGRPHTVCQVNPMRRGLFLSQDLPHDMRGPALAEDDGDRVRASQPGLGCVDSLPGSAWL